MEIVRKSVYQKPVKPHVNVVDFLMYKNRFVPVAAASSLQRQIKDELVYRF